MFKRLSIISFLLLSLCAPIGASAASVDVLDDVCKRANPTGSSTENPAACDDRTTDPTDNRQNPIYGPNGIITKIVNILTIIVGIVAVISIIAAGFRFITSGSNPQEVTRSRELIIYAIVGLLVAAFAQIMVRYVLDNVL